MLGDRLPGERWSTLSYRGSADLKQRLVGPAVQGSQDAASLRVSQGPEDEVKLFILHPEIMQSYYCIIGLT